MRAGFGVVLLAVGLAACSHTPDDLADRGLEPVNVPVVERSTLQFDAAAPNGMLGMGEAERIDAWFRGLGLGYGDRVHVDGGYAGGAYGGGAYAGGAYGGGARAEVAAIAGRYGLLVSPGAPVSAGVVREGVARILVARTRAFVPNCPNWSRASQPNSNNRSLSNLGCGVNSNLAAMVANPEDLAHGREGSGLGDTATSAKAIGAYRTAKPTGTEGLEDVNTRKGNE